MRRAITGFHRDEVGDWVAELECGHGQHVRHRPPFQLRPWVLDAGQRDGWRGKPLECPECGREGNGHGSPDGGPPGGTVGEPEAVGGEVPCLAGLVCPTCGSVHDDGPGAERVQPDRG